MVTVAVINFPTPGKNGAVDRKFLKDKAILIVGNFPEVHSHSITQFEKIQSCIKDFGGKAMRNFSSNTTYLLAGMNTPYQKFKIAEEKMLESSTSIG